MRVEKEGAKNEGGFFHMFDWTSKSRKKLFSTTPESLKQRRKVDGNLATMLPYLADEDGEIGIGGSSRDSADHSCATSVIDSEVCGTRAPGVVARLMGLDSLPSSSFSDPYSTPYYDSQCIQDVQYWRTKLNHLHDHRILYSGKLVEKAEGTSRNFMEANPLHTRSRPIEKFQTEVMPPKSAKSIPFTHHKLLSPIKNPRFVPSNNATYIMEAAARIIEPGRQAATKAKTPLVASSTVSLRVRDLKEKVEASQKRQLISSSSLTSRVRDTKGKRETSLRTSRFSESSQRLTESNDAKYLKGQSLSKSWNGLVDTLVRSSAQVEEEDCYSKNKGKSISLAIQAKVNVQRREGLSFSSGKSLVEQREQCDTKNSHKPLKANVQKSLHVKSSGQDASGVLRQNNQKQNCSMDRDKLPSKPLISNSQCRKVVTGDSSGGRHRSSSNKSIAKSKVGPKNSSTSVTDSEKEVLYTRTNNFPRKKRSTDRDWNGRVVDNLFIDKSQKPVQSNLVGNKYHGGAEDVKKKDTDVVSFTFSMPLTRINSGFETSGLNSMDQHMRRVFVDTETDNAGSPVGYNAIGGDALGILLDQKLRELTYGIGNSCDDSLEASSPSSTAPKSKDLVPTLNSVNLFPQLQQKKDMMLTDKLFSNRTCLPELSSQHRLRLDKMEECDIHPTEAELFNSGQPSPMSVLDPSFSTESCESPFSANATTSSEDQKRRKQVVGSGSGYTDLFDSASAWTMLRKQSSTCSQMKFGQSSTWELDYVNDILCNVELMYMDFSLGRARDIVNPHLFNQLENRRGRFESDGGECRIRRKAIFDCVSECLDLRCRRYVGGGYKMWAKGVAMVRRNEWLAREVWKEISSWRDMGDSMVDELVDRDMSIQYGQWLDFEVDTFQLGAVVEDQIFDSLVDDFVAEILQL